VASENQRDRERVGRLKIRVSVGAGTGMGDVMNPALLLMGVYILVAVVGQLVGLGVSRIVDQFDPAMGLTTFLLLFMAMFGVAWPIAVYLTAPRVVPQSK
jgi:hypothetical protein